MPTPTIPDGELFMNATTYTGSGTTTRSITNGATGQSFQPDFVWLKSRSLAIGHTLYDSVRTAGATKALYSNSTEAEGGTPGSTASAEFGYISSFDSNGFSTSSGSVNGNYVNSTSNTYVAWQWKAGGAAVTNTAGSISAQVSANTTSGFSVVTYTGTGANATVGHGLGVAPSMIIVKNRSSSSVWNCWHTSLGGPNSTSYIYLSSTAAAGSDGAFTYWGANTFNSTVISVGAFTSTNGNGNSMVAYCWTPIAGYSAFGSYTGNGSADGPFVYTNFQPRFIMVKRTDSTGTWEMYDTARDTFNVMSADLAANLADAEVSVARFDFVSNGFKLRNTGAAVNASGGTYIYMAFASNPFKYANAR